MLVFRGFALPAVTLYLTNTAFTSFFKKGVNFRSLFLLIIITAGVIEAVGYSGIPHNLVIRSYFSPVTVTFALCVWLLIYSSDLSKFPNIRVITRSSYFLFFTHWIIIRCFENFYPSFVEANVWIAYVIVGVGAYISSTILFTIYSWLTTKLLKL